MPSPARSIASLSLSFGLVAIPVKLYSATLPAERISFNFLREKDGSRVKQQYVAVADGKPVERSEMVKFEELGVGPAPVSDAQMQLAQQLVDHLKVRRFDPNDYVDEFKSRVAAAIQEKLAGHDIVLAATADAEPAGNVLDLMAALKASLAANRVPPSETTMARPKDRKAPKKATARHSQTQHPPTQHSSTHHPATKRLRRPGV